jgi:hypothetical protein
MLCIIFLKKCSIKKQGQFLPWPGILGLKHTSFQSASSIIDDWVYSTVNIKHICDAKGAIPIFMMWPSHGLGALMIRIGEYYAHSQCPLRAG